MAGDGPGHWVSVTPEAGGHQTRATYSGPLTGQNLPSPSAWEPPARVFPGSSQGLPPTAPLQALPEMDFPQALSQRGSDTHHRKSTCTDPILPARPQAGHCSPRPRTLTTGLQVLWAPF